ncbi:MAG: tetraacyldisaccharide 4'-kinase [Blastocatellia bacterium]|nr:tetraacyldisaccharide 4'-kinase [Blastocatellia bacterium]
MIKTTLLTPFSWLYGAVINTRRSLFEKGVFASFDLGVKTISVGNITVGGTGKTPLVAFIAQFLSEKGEKVCILTRGYGRDNPKQRVLVSDGEKILADAKDSGDEPFELANKLLGKAIIIADAKRAEAGKWAREEFGVTTFILDDGFQHLRIKRSLDIVLLDATNPFGNGKLLPKGILREPIESLKRADAVVITRANLVKKCFHRLRKKVLQIKLKFAKFFVSKNQFSRLINLKDFLLPAQINTTSNIKNLNSLAFCGLGNPDNFFIQLRQEKFNLAHCRTFPDHHIYRQNEIQKLERDAIKKGAEVLLTTAKDAVKLTHLKFNLPCFVVENGLTFDDESAFINLIQNPKSKS